MSYGLLVSNENNAIQIDSTYKNMVLTQKGTVSVNGNVKIPFDLYAHPEAMIAVRPRGNHGIYQAVPKQVDGGFFIHGGRYSADSSTYLVDYMIFVLPDVSASPASHGLQVFNGEGEQVFNSGYDYLKVTDVIDTGPIPTGPGYEAAYGYYDIPSNINGLYFLSPTGLADTQVVAEGGITATFYSWSFFTSDNRIGVDNSAGINDGIKFFLCAPL